MLDQKYIEALVDWATKTGIDTPAFAFAPQVVHNAVFQLRRELGGCISYATKSNAHPLILRELIPLVDAFNVTNIVHTDLLISLGVQPDRLIFIHPVANSVILEAVLDRGIRRFVVDDLRGLHLLADFKRSVSITLRMLPPTLRETEFSLAKFGAGTELVVKIALKAAEAGMPIEAISFFLGGGITTPTLFVEALDAVVGVYEQLAHRGLQIQAINIGGGFLGSRSAIFRDNPSFFSEIRSSFKARFSADVTLWSEPGRFLCQSAIALFTKVIAVRHIGQRRLLYLDASVYGGLGDCFLHRGFPLSFQTKSASPLTDFDIVGPLTDSHDTLRLNGPVASPTSGELVIIPNIGAYTWDMATKCEGLSNPFFVELPVELQRSFEFAWFETALSDRCDPCAS